jgi:hypothetical protein
MAAETRYVPTERGASNAEMGWDLPKMAPSRPVRIRMHAQSCPGPELPPCAQRQTPIARTNQNWSRAVTHSLGGIGFSIVNVGELRGGKHRFGRVVRRCGGMAGAAIARI